jgi:hypothetical protein
MQDALTQMWAAVAGRRDEHLRLAREHLSLTREDVERSVRQSWNR